MKAKESLTEIGKSISTHSQTENRRGIRNKSFARALCIVDRTDGKQECVYWLTNNEGSVMYKRYDITGAYVSSVQVVRTSLEHDGQPI